MPSLKRTALSSKKKKAPAKEEPKMSKRTERLVSRLQRVNFASLKENFDVIVPPRLDEMSVKSQWFKAIDEKTHYVYFRDGHGHPISVWAIVKLPVLQETDEPVWAGVRVTKSPDDPSDRNVARIHACRKMLHAMRTLMHSADSNDIVAMIATSRAKKLRIMDREEVKALKQRGKLNSSLMREIWSTLRFMEKPEIEWLSGAILDESDHRHFARP